MPGVTGLSPGQIDEQLNTGKLCLCILLQACPVVDCFLIVGLHRGSNSRTFPERSCRKQNQSVGTITV